MPHRPHLPVAAMRCLTLTQPWAGLVASGIKLIENRPRHIVRREDFGRPFALHAGSKIDESVYRRIREAATELFLDEHLTEEQLPAWYRLSRITGAVIAVATIDAAFDADSLSEDALATEVERAGLHEDQIRWAFGPVCYVLRDIQVLAQPVPHRGLQGFVRLPPHIEERVRTQMPGGGR